MRAARRPAVARGDRRPVGARLRRRPPAPRRAWCCPARGGATARPPVPARWLTRLETLPGRAGAGAAASIPAAAWVRAARPAGRRAASRSGRRGPCPPVALRPRRLSRHRDRDLAARSLRDLCPARAEAARRCEPLDEATDAADYGSLVHAGLHRFLRRSSARRWPADARGQLRAGDGPRAGARPGCARRWPPGGRRGSSASPTGWPRSRRSGAARAAARRASPPRSSGDAGAARPGGCSA